MTSKADKIRERREALKRERSALVKSTRTNKAIGNSISGGGGVNFTGLCLGVQQLQQQTRITVLLHGSFAGKEFKEDWATAVSDTEFSMNVRKKLKTGNAAGNKIVYETVSTEPVKIGQILDLSVYGTNPPTTDDGRFLAAGDFLECYGVKAVYDEQRDRVFWNCADAKHTPNDGTYLDALHIIQERPPSKLDIREITLPYYPTQTEAEKEEAKKQRANWTEEQWRQFRHINTNVLMFMGASPEGVFEEVSGQALEPPQYHDDDDSWSYKDKQGNLRKKARIVVPLTRWNHEEDEPQKPVVVQVTVPDKYTQGFGIADPDQWKSLAKHNVPQMRWGTVAFIAHERTLRDEINSKANTTKFQFTVLLMCNQVFADVGQHLRDNCLPVTYEKVVADLGVTVQSRWAADNELARRTNQDVINLTEYAGALAPLRDGYEFYAMINQKVNKHARALINALSDHAAQATRCVSELEGETSEFGLPDTPIVEYFAVRRAATTTNGESAAKRVRAE